jgi:ParB-like chromosome segregation protein Spo0J
LRTVERYRQLLEDGRDAPPVRLAPHGDRYLVRDGRHRVHAARAAGFSMIEAEVR